LLVIYSGSTAAVATIFASYAAAVFDLPAAATTPLAVGALVFVAGINLCGLFLAGAGTPVLAGDPAHAGAGFMGAALPVLFAYSGFTYLNNLAGEVREPQRTLPRALLLGMLGVIAAYALVNVAYLAVLGHAGLAASRT